MAAINPMVAHPIDWYDELMQGIKQKDIHRVKKALEHDYDQNKMDPNGDIPLMKAIKSKDKKIAKLVASKQKDVNISDPYGWTPLHLAVFFKLKPVVRLLLSKQARVNEKNLYGETPLHIAVLTKHSIIKLLIKAKANPLVKTSLRRTPYKIARIIHSKNLQTLLTYTKAWKRKIKS